MSTSQGANVLLNSAALYSISSMAIMPRSFCARCVTQESSKKPGHQRGCSLIARNVKCWFIIRVCCVNLAKSLARNKENSDLTISGEDVSAGLGEFAGKSAGGELIECPRPSFHGESGREKDRFVKARRPGRNEIQNGNWKE